jgi:hypothetical protein
MRRQRIYIDNATAETFTFATPTAKQSHKTIITLTKKITDHAVVERQSTCRLSPMEGRHGALLFLVIFFPGCSVPRAARTS